MGSREGVSLAVEENSLVVPAGPVFLQTASYPLLSSWRKIRAEKLLTFLHGTTCVIEMTLTASHPFRT